TGPVLNTLVTGTQVSGERVSIDSYNGLTSEAIGANAFANGSVGPVSVLNPPNFLPFSNPSVTGNPSVIPVQSNSVWALETANFPRLRLRYCGPALRQLQHQRDEERLSHRLGHFQHGELQCRLVGQAAADGERLRRLRHLI